MSEFHSNIYGIGLVSNYPLAGLPSAALTSPPELSIELNQGPDLQAAGNCRLWGPASANCYARWQPDLQLRVHTQLALDEITDLLCSSFIPALLCAHDALVLRGTAVLGPDGDGAVLILGPSMCGKSVAAASLASHGWSVISDDVVVLRRVQGQLRVFPGAPWIKLWPSMDELGRALGPAQGAVRRGLSKQRYGLASTRRCDLPIPEQSPGTSRSFAVTRALVLRATDTLEWESAPITASALLEVLGVLQRPPPVAPATATVALQFSMLCALARLPNPICVSRPLDEASSVAAISKRWLQLLRGDCI